MGNLTETFSEMAAKELAEGNFEKTITLLKGENGLGRELRDELAAMLEGFGSNKTRLELKSKNGQVKKSHIERDLEIYEAVEELVFTSGCTLDSAYQNLSGGQRGQVYAMGKDAIKAIHLRMRKAMREYDQICREG
jgi:hypothetical protein